MVHANTPILVGSGQITLHEIRSTGGVKVARDGELCRFTLAD